MIGWEMRYNSKIFPQPAQIHRLTKDLPEVSRALFVEGVPTAFIAPRYTADRELTLLDRDLVGPIIRFGSTGLHGAIGVASRGGEVVEVIEIGKPDLLFVNSSLPQFCDTVKAMTARYPYYGEDADPEEYQKVAGELLAIVRNIDPGAAVADRYWSTFVDDVDIGDLTTEAIEAITRGACGR